LKPAARIALQITGKVRRPSPRGNRGYEFRCACHQIVFRSLIERLNLNGQTDCFPGLRSSNPNLSPKHSSPPLGDLPVITLQAFAQGRAAGHTEQLAKNSFPRRRRIRVEPEPADLRTIGTLADPQIHLESGILSFVLSLVEVVEAQAICQQGPVGPGAPAERWEPPWRLFVRCLRGQPDSRIRAPARAKFGRRPAWPERRVWHSRAARFMKTTV